MPLCCLLLIWPFSFSVLRDFKEFLNRKGLKTSHCYIIIVCIYKITPKYCMNTFWIFTYEKYIWSIDIFYIKYIYFQIIHRQKILLMTSGPVSTLQTWQAWCNLLTYTYSNACHECNDCYHPLRLLTWASQRSKHETISFRGKKQWIYIHVNIGDLLPEARS